MKTIAVIPSRYGSTRFPGKSLAPICGKPLVRWVAEACLRARTLDEVLVATDDERIAAAVEGTGARAVMTPSDLPSGTDRVAVAAQAADDDVVVNVQGDEPLIDPALIDALAARLRDDAALDMSTAVSPIASPGDIAAKTVVKVVLDRFDRALYFSRSPIPADRDGTVDPAGGLYLRHLGIYAYRGAFLRRYVAEKPCEIEMAEKLEQLRALWMGAKIAVVRTLDAGVGVDTPEDAERVGKILSERIAKGR